jgi:hypothetical protein
VIAVDRRSFLHAASATGALAMTGGLGKVRAETGPVPLLDLLEDAPRERLTPELIARIRDGLSYEELLTALSLAAVRNVQPYPDVGFKYHAFMALQAIDLTTRHLDTRERWLPAIWAVDYFKRAQSEERSESGWRMAPIGRASTASPVAARRDLVAALDGWDREAADTAVVAYSRLVGPDDVLELLLPYGARDLREIGHKAITVENTHRLLAVVGAEHAEPLLRSTVAALQNTGGDPDPASSDVAADRPGRLNRRRLDEIPRGWRDGRPDTRARADVLSALRTAAPEEAGEILVEALQRGVSPATLWEALLGAAMELLMRLPRIVPLHAQTTATALFYAYRTTEDERMQQIALLQCAAFVAMFRDLTGNAQPDLRIDALEPAAVRGHGDAAREEIFAEIPGNRLEACRKSLGYLLAGGNTAELIAAIRRHLARGAAQSHDYKFTEALLDAIAHVRDAAWQARLLSAGMAYFVGPTSRPVIAVREAVEELGE